MKTLNLVIITGVIVVVGTVTMIIINTFFHSSPVGLEEYEVDKSMENSSHTCTQEQTENSDPGPMSGFLCPIIFFHTYTKMGNNSGFEDVCFDKRYEADNYLLRAGENGSITYTIYPDLSLSDAIKFPHTNMTNYASFSHYMTSNGGRETWTYTNTLPGVGVHYEPKYEMLWPWSSTLVTATIYTNSDAKADSHWLVLAPGVCNGGQAFILTVENSSKK
ncbi:MAG: hypothetical protein KGI27_06195 [Thaumarchaeota archaeon]|nr:hypothetical protein [Nitrososphaerota archaeon]